MSIPVSASALLRIVLKKDCLVSVEFVSSSRTASVFCCFCLKLKFLSLPFLQLKNAICCWTCVCLEDCAWLLLVLPNTEVSVAPFSAVACPPPTLSRSHSNAKSAPLDFGLDVEDLNKRNEVNDVVCC